MTRFIQLALGISITLFPAFAWAQGAIAENTLNQLKSATVFVKAGTRSGQQSGSGVFFEKTKAAGWIATNAHVVCDQEGNHGTVTCVFGSGTRDERTFTASILGVDTSIDLAILEVLSSDLPEPIQIEADVPIRETVPIYVLGFPFGEILSTSRRNPAVTVSRGTVSSIRRDDQDRIALIQVDGGINPGNSGGPVVTESGALIGISVAKIRTADIGFAVPTDKLAKMLEGRVASVRFTRVNLEPDAALLNVNVTLLDPRGTIKEITLLSIPKAQVGKGNDSPQKDADGNWHPVSDKAHETPLVITRNVASGQIRFAREAGNDVYLFQLRTIRENNSTRLTEPSELNVATVGPADRRVREPRPRPKGVWTPSPEITQQRPVIQEFSDTITDIHVGGGGRFLVVHIPSQSTAEIFDLAKLKTVASVPTTPETLLTAGMDHLLVVNTFDNKIAIWSFTTLKKEREEELPIKGIIKAVAMGNASEGPMLVNWAVGAGSLDHAFYSLIELDALEATQLNAPRGRQRDAKETVRFRNTSYRDRVEIRASADGQTFGMWCTSHSPAGLETLRIVPKPVTSYEHTTVEHVAPTADGTRICTGRGLFSWDLVRKRGDDRCLPTSHADYYLVLTQSRVDVCRVSDGLPAWSLPLTVEIRRSDYRALRLSKLSYDKRFHCVPSMDLFITVPLTDDRLEIRHVSMLGETKETE